jgi:hypothetical protein
MTLTTRNWYLLAGIGFSLAALVLALVFAHIALPLFPGLVDEAAVRGFTYGMFPAWQVNPYVPFAVMLAAVVYAVITQTLVYQFFEKTQSPEIFFFALFVFSFTFECVRMALPLQQHYALPQVFAVTAERLELFGRFFGVFALFASSIYATGFKAQKQGTVLFLITLIALFFAIRIPIDPLAWDSGLRLNSGHRSMFRIIETVTALLAVASYLVSARMRGGKEFVLVGVGAFLAFMGRMFLLDANAFSTAALAFLCLLAGTGLVCKQLHRIYLWT